LEERRNKIFRKIIIRTQGSLYAKGWTTWVHNVLKMRKYEQILRKCAAKMKYRAAVLCLNAWCLYVATEKKHRRVVAAALHRIKNRVIISAFTSWKSTVARVVRNRRVIVVHLERRGRLHLEAHVKAWTSYFSIGRKTRTQLKRIWRLKRARFLRMYWSEWMGKAATRCTICHRKSRPSYKKDPPKLKSVKDWSKREGQWDPLRNSKKAIIPDFLKQLPPIKGSPPKSLHKTLMPRQSPEDMVGNRSMSSLKRIIDRAGKLQSMTAAARLELETSNRVLDGFVNDLMQSDILSETTRAELENIVTGDEDQSESNSTKALDRARNTQGLRSDLPGVPVNSIDTSDNSRPVVLPNPRGFDREKQADFKRRTNKNTSKKSALDML